MGGSNGIKQFIKDNKADNDNNLCKVINLGKLNSKTIAIDVSGMIHRAKIHSGNKKWFLQIINLMHKFSIYGIKPVFIFDGQPSIEKKHTIDQRKQRQDRIKQKLHNILDESLCFNRDIDRDLNRDLDNDNIDNDNIDNDNIDKLILNLSKQLNSIEIDDIIICKQICILMGIPFIHIKSLEADDIFPYLINEGIIDGVYSEDNDMFRRGCKNIYFGLDFNLNTIYEFNYDEFLNKMSITKEQFNNAYDSAGTDY